jgi:hypothetical protein
LHGRLLPLLAPDAGNAPGFIPWAVPQAPGVDDLASQRRKLDEQARGCVSRWEKTLLLVALPLTGVLSDAWGIDPVLILAGCALTAGLGLALIAEGLSGRLSEQAYGDVQESQRALVGAQHGLAALGTFGVASPAERASHGSVASDTTDYTPGERETTALHQLLFPSPAGERSVRDAGQEYAPMPLNHEEGGEMHGLGNGNPMH